MGAGRTQRSPILLAYTSSPSSRLGRALVESCTGSAWAFDIVLRMDARNATSNTEKGPQAMQLLQTCNVVHRLHGRGLKNRVRQIGNKG